MSKPHKLPPTYEVDELDYEQKVNYKLRIFETIYPKDKIVRIDDILEEVEYIYNKMTLGNINI